MMLTETDRMSWRKVWRLFKLDGRDTILLLLMVVLRMMLLMLGMGRVLSGALRYVVAVWMGKLLASRVRHSEEGI